MFSGTMTFNVDYRITSSYFKMISHDISVKQKLFHTFITTQKCYSKSSTDPSNSDQRQSYLRDSLSYDYPCEPHSQRLPFEKPIVNCTFSDHYSNTRCKPTRLLNRDISLTSGGDNQHPNVSLGPIFFLIFVSGLIRICILPNGILL